MGKNISKPPIGLRPKWYWQEERLEEVKDAMIRYLDAGLEVPEEYFSEYEELMKLKILHRKENDTTIKEKSHNS